MDTKWLTDHECGLLGCRADGDSEELVARIDAWAELLIKERKKLAKCRDLLWAVTERNSLLEEASEALERIREILEETKQNAE